MFNLHNQGNLDHALVSGVDAFASERAVRNGIRFTLLLRLCALLQMVYGFNWTGQSNGSYWLAKNSCELAVRWTLMHVLAAHAWPLSFLGAQGCATPLDHPPAGGTRWGEHGHVRLAMTGEGTEGLCMMYAFLFTPPKVWMQVRDLHCQCCAVDLAFKA